MATNMITSPGITGPNDALQQFEDPMELIQARRKQALALELMKQLQGGPQMPQQTQILAKMPLMATLAHIGAQSNARNQLADADKQIGDITKQQQTAYSSGISDFYGAGDKKDALARLMAANNPQLRAFASAQEKAMRDQAEKEAERRNVLAKEAMGNLSGVGAVPEALKIGATGVVDQNAPIPKPVEPKFGTIDGPNGPTATVVNTDMKTGNQTGHLGQGSISITNGNERELNKVVGGITGKSFEENLAAAKGAHALNNSLTNLESLSKDGVITGPATKPLEWIAGLGAAAGMPVDRAKLGNTGAFNAAAEQAVQAMIAGMQGGNRGITGEESKRIMGMLPMAANSPEARAQITADLRAINQRRIEGFSEQARAIEQAMRTGKFENLDQMLIPPSLGTVPPKGAPTPAPQGAPAVRPAAPQGALPGGQTPEIMAERIKIVKAEFDREQNPEAKAALGRELQRLQQSMGAAPAPASAPAVTSNRFPGFSIVR